LYFNSVVAKKGTDKKSLSNIAALTLAAIIGIA